MFFAAAAIKAATFETGSAFFRDHVAGRLKVALEDLDPGAADALAPVKNFRRQVEADPACYAVLDDALAKQSLSGHRAEAIDVVWAHAHHRAHEYIVTHGEVPSFLRIQE